jgi:hypothetical protein
LLGAFNIPFVLTYHADIIKQKLFLPIYRPVLNLLFKKARKVIFSARENIVPSVLDERQNKCAVIPFGVEIEAFHLQGQEETEVEALHQQLRGP